MTHFSHDVEHCLLEHVWIRHLGLHAESVNMGSSFSVHAHGWRGPRCRILSGESLECFSGHLREPSEDRQNYGVPDVSPWLNKAESILWIFVSKQALKVWVVVPSHTLRWQKHKHWCSQACGHDNPTVHLAAVLVGYDLAQELHPFLLVDIALSFFIFWDQGGSSPMSWALACIRLYTCTIDVSSA